VSRKCQNPLWLKLYNFLKRSRHHRHPLPDPMAFEQPLEADRVDDGHWNVLTLVSSPVVGMLSWVLGGEDDREIHSSNNESDIVQKEGPVKASSMDNHVSDCANGIKSMMLKERPSLVHSEVSDNSVLDKQATLPASEDSASKLKRLSWSDQLIQFDDEVRRRIAKRVHGILLGFS